MESSEKIINNYDVLHLIFRYLDFEEHLKLVKICPQFEYAIVHGVWRLNYKNLYIVETCSDTLHVQYNGENNVIIGRSLTTEATHIILHHSSMYIRKLELEHILGLENIISLKYHHLTELALRGIVIEDTHLQQVAENCLNLQSFSLKEFTTHLKESNIRANVFGQMKALNRLEIVDMDFTAWNYFDVQQLFCLAHLKTLIIHINISDSNDNNENNNNSKDSVYNIENLRIGRLRYIQSGNICFIEDLIRFENLINLSIRLDDDNHLTLDDNVLTQINNACSKLCELSFYGCDFKFKEFPSMNNLMHLTFNECTTIGLEHFDEIFRKLKLKSLSLMDVLMRDEAKDIIDYNYTSNTLETLTIRDAFVRHLVKIFFNRQHKFENVSKIKLEVVNSAFEGNKCLCFSHNFPNLQELIMDSYYISSEDILNLKQLKVLEFAEYCDMPWSYYDILLQHPTLTHITITPMDPDGFDYYYCNRLPICCEGLTTILEYLSLPSVVYESAPDFWSCFQQRNKLLKLEAVHGTLHFNTFDM